MSRGSDSRHSPGFDVQAAAFKLLKLAVDEDLVPKDDLKRLTKLVDPETGARSVSAIGLTFLGERHCMLHRTPPDGPYQEGDEILYCRRWPCRYAGIAHSLKEIGAYMQNLASGLLALADDLDYLTSAMRKLQPSVLDRVRSTAHAYKEAQAWREAQCSRPGELIDLSPWEDVLELIAIGERLQRELPDIAELIRRKQLTSPQLQRSWSRQGGRSSEKLLTAVWQHLHAAKFKAREVVRLVPDASAGSEEARIKRFQTRVAGADQRSEAPWQAYNSPPPARVRSSAREGGPEK